MPSEHAYVEVSNPENLKFLQVVGSDSLVFAALGRLLKEAGIHYGPEPPPEITSHCLVLLVQNKEDLSQTMGSVREASASAGSVKCPILVFAPQNDLELALASLRGGARGFVHAMMRPEQILRALSVVAT